MILPRELQLLKDHELDYEPSQATQQQLSGKTVVAIIAPTAVGKSTIIERVVERGAGEFSESHSVVTRERRSTDPKKYLTKNEGYTTARVTELIHEHKLTHYTIHPSGNIYASLPESFSTTYSLLPCVPQILSAVHRAGFKSMHSIYIVCSVKQWSAQLTHRHDDTHYEARLHEAITSLTWAIDHSEECLFVENVHDNLNVTADTIIAIAKGDTASTNKDHGISLAKAMRTFAIAELDNLLSSS